jgi:hypothetical protein
MAPAGGQDAMRLRHRQAMEYLTNPVRSLNPSFYQSPGSEKLYRWRLGMSRD